MCATLKLISDPHRTSRVRVHDDSTMYFMLSIYRHFNVIRILVQFICILFSISGYISHLSSGYNLYNYNTF